MLELRRVICTSSYGAAASHGKDQSTTVDEDEYVLPVSSRDMIPPYGATKLMNEELTYIYRHRYGVDAAIVRPAMVYGPGFPPDRITNHPMEALVHAAHRGQAVRASCGRDSTIDATYVKDIAVGFLRVLETAELPNWLYNISSGQVYSTGSMADAVAKAFPASSIELGPGEWRGLDGHGPPAAPIRPASDISRARRDLGYEPRFHLEAAANDYARWLGEQAY
jgi:nucleoside-diphosphate-sugar epimerase